jgi:hypothetical protein
VSEVNGVALFSRLKWPEDAFGERPLLVIESYEPSVWKLDDSDAPDAITGLRERGFELLKPDSWSFPYLDDHLVAIDESSDDFALIDDAADELFGYPISGIPQDWFSHLKLERNCLVITGVDLRLATDGMKGVKDACGNGRAFGAMVMINDGRVDEGVEF